MDSMVGTSETRVGGTRRSKTVKGKDETPADWNGRAIGDDHCISRHLADGGMSRVFLAEHTRLGSRVAVKVLAKDASEQVRRCFLAEAELLVELSHPNIVRIFDFDELPAGDRYLMLEHVSGTDLCWYLKKNGRMTPVRALGVLRQVGSALDYLHSRGVVHRDVKPGNIMIDCEAGDTVKLIDFGIARRLDDHESPELCGVISGTPAYMSPEQAAGHEVGPAGDLYALGALALELLTGQPPYAADRSPLALVLAVNSEPPRRPSELGMDLPGLDAVMATALARDPNERFASGAELIDALLAIFPQCADRPAAARPIRGLEAWGLRLPSWMHLQPAAYVAAVRTAFAGMPTVLAAVARR
jgi:serine/threonine-protein kinase